MLQLLKLEKWTLLKGWVISAIIVFPFTFLPILFKDGSLGERLINRMPSSFLYAVGFSLLLVIAALYQNYERQRQKFVLFKKPAIKRLGFSIETEGHKSLMEDLNVFLKGMYNDVTYRLDILIDLEEDGNSRLLINPILTALDYYDYKKLTAENAALLARDFQVTTSIRGVEVLLALNEVNFEDENSIRKFMTIIGAKIRRTSSDSE